ncbi:uncharacterized protein At2g29880-like [Apium graveolens]|uniref:uncharacterized protein At2g29880-like n=1 Tax=Apium graveolens TaxID=4045 RepID=UPI003D7AD256
MKFNSGCGDYSILKRFTAPNEVWDEYLKDHPEDGNLRNGVCDDYEDLQITVGSGVTIGKNSIGLGSVTDARTLKASEVQETCIDDLSYNLEGFEHNNLSPIGFPEVFELSKKNFQPKEAKARVYGLLQKWENEKIYTTWDAIKEVPNLSENVRLEPFNLLDTKTKKDGDPGHNGQISDPSKTRCSGSLLPVLDYEQILENKVDEEEMEVEIDNEFYKIVTLLLMMDCVCAIDGTHIPAMVRGREISSYRNRHGINSQKVLAACNFDLVVSLSSLH